MKKIVLYLFLLNCTINVNAQEWDEIGTTISYSQFSFFGEYVWPIKFTSIYQDQVTGHIDIEVQRNNTWTDTIMIHKDADKVFYFNEYLDTFTLLYDYSLVIGDTFTVHIDTEYKVVSVISDVYISQIDGHDILTQEIIQPAELNDYIYYWRNDLIYKDIGNHGYYFPVAGLADPAPGPIQCITTVTNETILFGDIPCDSIVTNVMDQNFEENIGLYPNPFSDQLILELNNPELKTTENISLKIYDVSGKEIFATQQKIEATHTLDLHFLNSGIYFISIQTSDNKVYRQKIVKI